MICLAAVIIPKPSAQQKSKLFCNKKNYTIFFLHWGPPRGYMLTSEWCSIEQYPKIKPSIIIKTGVRILSSDKETLIFKRILM